MKYLSRTACVGVGDSRENNHLIATDCEGMTLLKFV
jgi:hypothetical protein